MMVGSAQHVVYRFGSFALDLERGALLSADNTEISLRPKSFALLQFLVENAGRLLSRNAIMEALWSDIYVTDDNITQCIHDIRRALNGESAQLLRTVPRRGYIFSENVDIGKQTAGPTLSETGRRGFEDSQESRSSAPLQQPPVSKPPRLSILVTRLRDVGVPDMCKYLVDGITEDITADLSHLPGGFVIGHSDVLLRGSDSTSSRTTARELGLNYIIQGSMRGRADQIGVNAQIIDVETGVYLWAERFEIECVSAPDASNEMTGRLVRSLSIKLTEDADRRIEALPPRDWSPYDLVIRGRAMIDRPISAPNRHQAVSYFEQALARDSTLTDAKVGIAHALIGNVADGWSRSLVEPSVQEDEARAEQLLSDVLHGEEHHPTAHTLMGCLRRLQSRLQDSQIELGIAIGLTPNVPGVLGQLGMTLMMLGQPEAALPLIERSLRLAPHDPGTPMYFSSLGLCHLYQPP